MKTLAKYKSDYASRKTSKGKNSVANKAMLNLSHSDKQLFIKWQTNR